MSAAENEMPPNFADANNISDGMNIALKNLSYHLLKPGEEDEKTPPIPAMDEITDFKNTIYNLIQNVLIIIKKFKEKYSDTTDPILMNLYKDNFLWLKNLSLELHRLIAPSWAGNEGDPDAEILEIARSLGESINNVKNADVDKFEDMSGPDIDTNIPQYYKYVICPGKYPNGHKKEGEVCDELLNTRGNRKVRCPYCETDLIVDEKKSEKTDEKTDEKETTEDKPSNPVSTTP